EPHLTFVPDRLVPTRDGRFVLFVRRTGGNCLLTAWDVRKNRAELTLPPGFGRSSQAVFSVDGRTLASAEERVIEVYQGGEGASQEPVRIRRRPLPGLPELPFALSPDGKRLAVVDFSDDGDALTVRLWDTATGKRLGMLPRQSGLVDAVEFSPDGKELLTARKDDMHTMLAVWDVRTLKFRTGRTFVSPSSFNPDQVRRLIRAAGTDTVLMVRDVTSLGYVPRK